MSRWSAALGLATSMSLLLGGGAVGAEKFQKLNDAQIRASIAGKEFTDEVHLADVFGGGGVLTSYAMGRKIVGKWRVQNDQLCLERQKWSSGCFEVWVAGKKVELKVPNGTIPIEGVFQRPAVRD